MVPVAAAPGGCTADAFALLCAGGRYLGDVWILHMDSMAWSAVSPTNAIAAAEPGAPAENGSAPADGDAGADTAGTAPLLPLPLPLPPCAGHAMVAWGSRLLVLGGHMKAGRFRHAAQVPQALRLSLLCASHVACFHCAFCS